MNTFDGILVVRVQEEYGYREWLWLPEMAEEKLTEWWQSMPTVASHFFAGPVNFPGTVLRVYYDEADPDAKGFITKPDATDFVAVEEGKSGTLTQISKKYTLPENHWFAHVHTDNDSYLVDPEDKVFHHAGHIPDEIYFGDEEYEVSTEVEEAWEKANYEALRNIILEERGDTDAPPTWDEYQKLAENIEESEE